MSKLPQCDILKMIDLLAKNAERDGSNQPAIKTTFKEKQQQNGKPGCVEAEKTHLLDKNLAIMQIKKKDANELEDKFGKPKDEKELPKEAKGAESFPKYDEYDTVPGRGPKKKE